MRKTSLFNTLSFFCIFILLSVFIFYTAMPAATRTVEGIAIQVSDGDTFKLETVEGTKLKIRLYGIDAPETGKIDRITGKISKSGQPYGEEAYRALESKILGKKAKVDIMAIDRYKRMVGIIYIDSRNINLEMVKEGWAWAYREYLDRPYISKYLNTEKEARAKRLGLWQQANPQPPWEFRKLMRIK
jgi:micrococcal nuclease